MYSYILGLRKLAATLNKNRKLQQLQSDREQRHKTLGQYQNPYADDHFTQDGSFQDTARARQYAQQLNTQFKPIWQRYNDKYTKLQQEHASRPDNWKPGVSSMYQRNVKQLYRKYQDQLSRLHRGNDHTGQFIAAVDRHRNLSGQYGKHQLSNIEQSMRNRYPDRNFRVRMQKYTDQQGRIMYMPTVSQGTQGVPGYHSYGYSSWVPEQGQPARVDLKPR